MSAFCGAPGSARGLYQRTSSGLVCSAFGSSWCAREHCITSISILSVCFDRDSYLESASHAEDSVVGFFGRQPLQSLEHDGALFGDQIIGSVAQNVSAQLDVGI